MNIEELEDKHKEICQEALNLVSQRNEEYASKGDLLKTFIETAEELGTEPYRIALVLLAIKHKRIVEQIKNRKPIRDSIRDLINYAIYVEALLEEESSTIVHTVTDTDESYLIKHSEPRKVY